jgi:DnaJ-class molecular chaperone
MAIHDMKRDREALARAIERIDGDIAREEVRLRPCLRCHGDGRISHCNDSYCSEELKCPECNGTRLAPPLSDTRDCTFCVGTGRANQRDRVYCSACNGTGATR